MSPPLILAFAAVAIVLLGWTFSITLRQLDTGITMWADGKGPVRFSILWQSIAGAVIGAAGLAIALTVTSRGELIPMIGFVGYGTATMMAAVNAFTFRLNHQDLVIRRRYDHPWG